MLKKKKKGLSITVLRQLGGIGDMLLCGPVFRGLKEKYPDCNLTVGTSWMYASGALPALLKGNPYIDNVVRIEPTQYAPNMLRTHRHEYRDVANDFIPVCVQEADLVIELNVICAVVETLTQPNVTKHRTDIWCEHAGVNPSCKKPILNLTKEELAEGARWCDENLGEGIRVGLPLKAMANIRSWPHSDDFAFDLQRKGYKVVTIDPIRRVHDSIPALIGKQIRFVASVIANLDIVVTPDTGILHVAGAVGTPILGLFGSTIPELRMREYAGRFTVPKRIIPCGGCFYTYPCLRERDTTLHGACMTRISRKLAMHEMEKYLEEELLPMKATPVSVV